MTSPDPSVGSLIREWRQRRHFSQLGLALEAEISQKHLSFVESGRSVPSRAMVLRLAEQLEIPLRERNALLVTAGFAPVYRSRAADDPEMEAARAAVALILAGHEPNPALAIDRHWTLVSANRAVAHLLAGVDPELLRPPVNVLRLSLHPGGLGPRIGNFRQWRAHILARLGRQIENSADPGLMALRDDLKAFPVPSGARPHRSGSEGALGGVAMPLELVTDFGRLSFISTTTVFGTALEISLSELAIESFFPADRETALVMRRLGESAEME